MTIPDQIHDEVFMITDLPDVTDHSDTIAAVLDNPWLIQHIHDQTDDICLTAVKRIGITLQFVNNQTEEICLAAVNTFPYALQYVRDQTEAICIAAVKRNPFAIKCVNNQTEAICAAALHTDPHIKYLIHPSFSYLF
jgi:hypothetical protein